MIAYGPVIDAPNLANVRQALAATLQTVLQTYRTRRGPPGGTPAGALPAAARLGAASVYGFSGFHRELGLCEGRLCAYPY